MLRQWEEFPANLRGDGTHLHITLSRKGEILIGAAAMEQLGNPSAAVLLFDRVNKLIGIRPVRRDTANAHLLKAKGNARHRILQAARFCTHHGIKTDRTIAFNAPQIDEDGTLILNLSTITPIGKPRASRR